jgi:hypothetical protein
VLESVALRPSRTQVVRHLESLEKRFPQLASLAIGEAMLEATR